MDTTYHFWIKLFSRSVPQNVFKKTSTTVELFSSCNWSFQNFQKPPLWFSFVERKTDGNEVKIGSMVFECERIQFEMNLSKRKFFTHCKFIGEIPKRIYSRNQKSGRKIPLENSLKTKSLRKCPSGQLLWENIFAK